MCVYIRNESGERINGKKGTNVMVIGGKREVIRIHT